MSSVGCSVPTGDIKKEEGQETAKSDTFDQKTESRASEAVKVKTDDLKQEGSTADINEETKADENPATHEVKNELKNSNKTLETRKERENMQASRLKNVTKLVGAHVSASGGVHNAITNCLSIGANAFAIFLRNQRRWDAAPLDPKIVTKFRESCVTHNYKPNCILPHGSYLINLGNPDKEKRDKSYEAFLEDLKRCEMLGIQTYNFHPGSSVGKCTIDQSILHIAECINKAHGETKSVICVIENMAGSGNVVGSKFEELAKIISHVQDKSRVGICIDTCHTFAAGYDIRTSKEYEKTMSEFSRIIGFQYLRGMHLNDSLTDLGSNRDRHANIGKGYLGLEPFRLIMNDDRLDGIPLILETPVSKDDEYKKEIELLYGLVGKSTLSEANIPGDFVEGQDVKGNKEKRSIKSMFEVDPDKPKKKAKSK